MNKRAVNKDVYENYIDASVALFMEYYSVVSLSDNVQAELDAANCDEIQFPAQLDGRCRQLIKNRTAHYRRKQYLKTCWKGLKYAAACVMVVLSLTSVLFMTVEAVRVPIINYYIEQCEGHWEIDRGGNDDSTKAREEIDLVNLLGNVIPEDYQMVVKNGDSLENMAVSYKNPNGKRFYCRTAPGYNWTTVDSEDAQTSRQQQICGYNAITVEKDGRVQLTWIHFDLGIVFSMFADDMSEAEITAIGERLIESINK